MSFYKKKKSQKLETKIDVTIPLEVQGQIKHLCKTINTIEWSGVLYYTLEGSIKDPKNCKITLQQILPMDIGTAGYTEYEIDGRVTKFMREHDALEKEWKMGHIHSHHSMSVFFSGTDQSEIEDNSEHHNFYLSVIVNNKGDIVGKVGITAESNLPDEGSEIKYIAKDEEGEEYSIEDIVVKSEKKYFEYNCEFYLEEEELVSENFLDLMSNMKKHNRSEFSTSTNNSNPSSSSSREGQIGFTTQNSQVSGSTVTRTSVNRPELEDRLEELLLTLFANGENLESLRLSTMEDILDYYNAVDENGEELAESMVKAYPKLFEEIFKDERQPPRFYILRKVYEAFEELHTPGNIQFNIIVDPIAKAFKKLYEQEWAKTD